jgi:hypothetical protein
VQAESSENREVSITQQLYLMGCSGDVIPRVVLLNVSTML